MITTLAKAFAQTNITSNSLNDLRNSLSAYVEEFETDDKDASAHLQEELRNVFREYVDTNLRKLGPFMAVLRTLQPCITTEEDIIEWFDKAVKPFADQLGPKKVAVEDAREFVVAAMTYDEEAPDAKERSQTSAQLAQNLLNVYMSRTRVSLEDATAGPSPQIQNHAAQQLLGMLVAFGRKMPKDLFNAVDACIVRAETRLQALILLSSFIEQQQSNIYQVIDTPVVEHLIKCLMNDTPTVVVSAALRCLIMLLPHIPVRVARDLPRLFLIYSRCLCWEKFSSTSTKAQKDLVTDDRVRRNSDSDTEDILEDPTWETLHSQPDLPETTAPELLLYFTYLYGLYPLNFMGYIRKPRKYLKRIDFPGADDFDLDQAVIRSRTEQFQRVHLLHPSFFNTTIEEELVENRWLKAEPAEVIAECHGLYVGNNTQHVPTSPGPPPSNKLPALPVLSPDSTMHAGASRSGAASPATSFSWTGTGSWRSLPPAAPAPIFSDNGSPTLPGMLERVEAGAKQDESAESRRGSAATAHTSFTNPEESSRPDTGVSVRASVSSGTAPHSNDMVWLQRELISLRNELTFERYLKQQHLTAIGQLKRNNVKAITVEAETATLINANRALQKKLSDLNKFNEKMQKETQARRTHTKQSEDQLTAKIRTLRADLASHQSLKTDLESAGDDVDQLRQLLVESEAREMRLRQEMDAQQKQLKELEYLKGEIDESRKQLQLYQAKQSELEEAKTEHDNLQHDIETLRRMLQDRDVERQRSQKTFQTTIQDLQTRLDLAESISLKPPQTSIASSDRLEQLLQDARNKQAQIKRAYTQLLQEHAELKIKYQELAAEHGIFDSPSSLPIPISPPRPRRPDEMPDFASTNGSVNSYSTGSSLRQAPLPYDYPDMYPAVQGHGQPFPQNYLSNRGQIYSQRNVSPLSRNDGFLGVQGYEIPTVVHPQRAHGRSVASGSEISVPPGGTGAHGSFSGVSGGERIKDSSKSAFSLGSDDGGETKGKSKIDAKSEVRVFGRGKQALSPFPLSVVRCGGEGVRIKLY